MVEGWPWGAREHPVGWRRDRDSLRKVSKEIPGWIHSWGGGVTICKAELGRGYAMPGKLGHLSLAFVQIMYHY